MTVAAGPTAGVLVGAGPATVSVVVASVALLAVLPWWAARAGAGGRAARLARGPGPAGDGRSARAEEIDVPVLLELLGAALRAGAGVPRALEAAAAAVEGTVANGTTTDGGADGVALRVAADALRLGADWDGAWRGAPARLAPVQRALRGAWTDGASPSGALRAAGDELVRERRSAARTAAGRLAVQLVLPLGACFLPAFVLVGLVPVLLALGIDLLSG